MMEKKRPGSVVETVDGRHGKIFSISGSGEEAIATVEIESEKKTFLGLPAKVKEDILLKNLKTITY